MDKLIDYIEINPSTNLSKGVAYPFVEMKDLSPDNKFVSAKQRKPYKGAGSKFQQGDTLLARITPCLENGKTSKFISVNCEKGFGSSEFIILRKKEGKSLNDYIYYLCRTKIFREYAIQNMIGTSGRQRVPNEIIASFEYSFPSIKEQEKIIKILNPLDNKIENNKKINQILEEIAKSIFKSWFIDFDPVRAKAQGHSTGLPDEISDLFPSSFEDSELGEIPRHWINSPISELIEINPTRKIAKNTVAPFLEMKGVPTSGHTVTGVYNRGFTSGTKFQQGDTLLARITPCLENGKTAMVDFLDDGQIGWGSTEFIVLCGKNKIHNPFVYYLSRSDIFREHAIRNMSGSSGRQRVPYDSLCDFNIAKPPITILNKFSEIASSFLQKITIGSKEISSLERMRNTLLPKLILGELSIPDAEQILEEVGI